MPVLVLAPKHVIVSFVSAFVTITGYHCPLSIHLSQIIYENIKERFLKEFSTHSDILVKFNAFQMHGDKRP